MSDKTWKAWIPAFAGMTERGESPLLTRTSPPRRRGTSPKRIQFLSEVCSVNARILFTLVMGGLLLCCLPASTAAMGGKTPKEKSATEAATPQQARQVNVLPQKEVADIFTYEGSATQAKQEATFAAIKGTGIDWIVQVAELNREKDDVYQLQTSATPDSMGCFIFTRPRTEKDRDFLLNAKRGDLVRVQGVIVNLKLRHLIIADGHVTRPEK